MNEILDRDALARVIWETSRADEGTISVTGANIVADAVIAHLSARQNHTENGAVVTTEWGVRVSTVGRTTLHRSEDSARADVEFWGNYVDPNPAATKFPRVLVQRMAATEWVEVA